MDKQLKKNMGRCIVGTLAIPAVTAVILLTICALGGRKMIDTALRRNLSRGLSAKNYSYCT